MADAINRNSLVDWYEGLAPTDIGYANLSAGYVRYRRLIRDGGGWPVFSAGPTIEPDTSDPRILPLIRRLVAEGDLSAAAGTRLALGGGFYGFLCFFECCFIGGVLRCNDSISILASFHTV